MGIDRIAERTRQCAVQRPTAIKTALPPGSTAGFICSADFVLPFKNLQLFLSERGTNQAKQLSGGSFVSKLGPSQCLHPHFGLWPGVSSRPILSHCASRRRVARLPRHGIGYLACQGMPGHDESRHTTQSKRRSICLLVCIWSLGQGIPCCSLQRAKSVQTLNPPSPISLAPHSTLQHLWGMYLVDPLVLGTAGM